MQKAGKDCGRWVSLLLLVEFLCVASRCVQYSICPSTSKLKMLSCKVISRMWQHHKQYIKLDHTLVPLNGITCHSMESKVAEVLSLVSKNIN